MSPNSLKISAAAVGAALLVASAAANAALITYDVRSIASPSFADYQSGWAAQGSPINSSTPAGFDSLAGGNNSYNHLQVAFDIGNAYAGQSLLFQLGLDAGYGGALYFDGVLIDTKNDDLWWGSNWGNTAELLTGNVANLTVGAHTLDAYWAEGCCNGTQAGRISVNGGAWQALSLTNFDRLAVPEPGSLALFGLALAGVVGARRKKSAA